VFHGQFQQQFQQRKNMTKTQTNPALDKFTGCLLGGAIGDALGASVEFMTLAEIHNHFGNKGIADYEMAYGKLGAITDDTQMTLFTVEGLIRGYVRGNTKGITTYSGVVANAYLRWLKTQDECPYHNLEFNGESGWLFRQPELHHRRAPGNTCISVLKQMKSLGKAAINDSKGCGSVMRIAPVGLFAWRLNQDNLPMDTFKLGKEIAALTHGHPTGILTSGFLAVLIQFLVHGISMKEALQKAKQCLKTERDNEETLHAIELAEELANSDMPHIEAISKLGQGWIAEEALAISIYCTLVAKSFSHGVLLAVNHDGDSDSTGAITGNLLGVIHGIGAIPEKWLSSVELHDVIKEIAEDLYSLPDWNFREYPKCELILHKYPGV
jgi:ADP-ribosylglycohydrolase